MASSLEDAAGVAGAQDHALGLAGGEAAVAVLAYLAAHALWLDDAPASRRAVALAPIAQLAARMGRA